MPGDVTLGALLGANQSFDDGVLTPWSKLSDQASAYVVSSATAVHSSAYGLFTVSSSTGGTPHLVSYELGGASGAAAAAFPGVNTHTLWSWAWVGATDAPSSGQTRWRASGDTDSFGDPIAYAGALQRKVASTVTTSPGGSVQAGLDRVTSAGATAAIAVDDVLTQIDPIVLHPEWSLEDQSALLQAAHRTSAGRLQSVNWGSFRAFTVPLRWLMQSDADLLNWWWMAQLPLAFCLDTSDTAAVWVCRITNATQPVGKRMTPYTDRWSGSLTLESLDPGSLVF